MLTTKDQTTTSPAAGPRRGRRERVETGIYRRHEVSCTTRRCGCPFLITYRTGGESHQTTVHGSLSVARKRRAAAIANATPTSRPPRAVGAVGPAAIEPTLDAHFQDLIGRRSAAGTWCYNTARRHEEVWVGGLSQHFGALRAGEVAARTVRCWEAFLAEHPGRFSHHEQAKRTLSALFQSLKTEELMANNPAGRLRVPARSPEKTQQVDRVLDADELALLLRNGPTDMRQRTMLAALGMGGLRRAEVLGLRVGDIDLAAGVVRLERQAITVEREKADDGTTLVSAHRRITALKGRARRDWHLPPSVRGWFAEYLASHPGGADAYMWPGGRRLSSDPLPEGAAVGVMEAASVAHMVRRACTRVGLVNATGRARTTPHGLRHTCAVLMIKRGEALAAVSLHLGHESVRITEQTYLKWLTLSDHERRRIAAGWDAVLEDRA